MKTESASNPREVSAVLTSAILDANRPGGAASVWPARWCRASRREEHTIWLPLIGCAAAAAGPVPRHNSVHGPVKLVPWADLVESGDDGAQISATSWRADRRPQGPAVLGSTPTEGHRLPRPERRRHVTTIPASAHAVGIRGEEGRERLHGEIVCADVPGLRRLIRPRGGREEEPQDRRGLAMAHTPNRQELIKRIRDGAIGDIQLIRAYRVHACGGLARNAGPG